MQDGHVLHVEGLREEVHGRHAHGFEHALVTEAREVAGKRRGVAGDVGDGARRLVGELRHHVGSKARAWRVDHDDVRVDVWELDARVSANGVDIGEVCRVKVVTQVSHGWAVGLDSRDKAGLARQRQREGACPAVEVHGLLVLAGGETLHHQRDELVRAPGVHLEERGCRDTHGLASHKLAPGALAREALDAGDAARLSRSLLHDSDHGSHLGGIPQHLGHLGAREGAGCAPEGYLELLRAPRSAYAHTLQAQVARAGKEVHGPLHGLHDALELGVQKRAGGNLHHVRRACRMHAHHGAPALGSHGKLDLVAVAPGLAGGHDGRYEGLGILCREAPQARERVDNAGALGGKLGLVGQMRPGTTATDVHKGAGRCHAVRRVLEHRGHMRTREARLLGVRLGLHGIAGHATRNEHGLAIGIVRNRLWAVAHTLDL